jgi:hypothetical protein
MVIQVLRFRFSAIRIGIAGWEVGLKVVQGLKGSGFEE